MMYLLMRTTLPAAGYVGTALVSVPFGGACADTSTLGDTRTRATTVIAAKTLRRIGIVRGPSMQASFTQVARRRDKRSRSRPHRRDFGLHLTFSETASQAEHS